MENRFKTILLGKGNKKDHRIYSVMIALFFFVCLGLSQLLYPAPGYDWTNRYISEEGNPIGNQKGWYFFSLGICGIAILLIPHFLYIYRHLPSTLLISKFLLFFTFTGSIGLFIVGVISELNELPHNIAAGIAFGSFGLAIFSSLLIFLYKLVKKEVWPKMGQIIVFYCIIISMGIFVANGMIVHFGEKTSVYQWIGFWIMFVWFLGMYLIIPNKREADN
jgi:Protein of unknown function (DUF998)